MKNAMVILCTMLLGFGVVGNAYALDVNHDGYAYNQASMADRLTVCKHLEPVLGKDCYAWLGFLNSFYDTRNARILAACRSYRFQPIFVPEEIFLLAHYARLIVNPKGT